MAGFSSPLEAPIVRWQQEGLTRLMAVSDVLRAACTAGVRDPAGGVSGGVSQRCSPHTLAPAVVCMATKAASNELYDSVLRCKDCEWLAARRVCDAAITAVPALCGPPSYPALPQGGMPSHWLHIPTCPTPSHTSRLRLGCRQWRRGVLSWRKAPVLQEAGRQRRCLGEPARAGACGAVHVFARPSSVL